MNKKIFYKKPSRERWFVADEGDGIFNPFSTEMFDEDGWLLEYEGMEGYNIEDYDIVCWCNSEKEAFRKAEELTEAYENEKETYSCKRANPRRSFSGQSNTHLSGAFVDAMIRLIIEEGPVRISKEGQGYADKKPLLLDMRNSEIVPYMEKLLEGADRKGVVLDKQPFGKVEKSLQIIKVDNSFMYTVIIERVGERGDVLKAVLEVDTDNDVQLREVSYDFGKYIVPEEVFRSMIY